MAHRSDLFNGSSRFTFQENEIEVANRILLSAEAANFDARIDARIDGVRC
jgi:hypothetical protein